MNQDQTTKHLCRLCSGRGFIPHHGTEILPDGSTKPLPIQILDCPICTNYPLAKK